MSYIGTMMESNARVYRPITGRDARQGVTQEFRPVDMTNGGLAANRLEQDPIPCSVQQATPRDILLYGQKNAEFNTVIIFEQNPHCQMNDQIRAVDLTGNETYYNVVGAARPVGRAVQWIVTANFIEQPLFP